MTWEGVYSYQEMVGLLEAVNASANNGRGVGCIRSVINYLKMFDGESARLVCNTDYDKISNYPEIVNVLREIKLIK